MEMVKALYLEPKEYFKVGFKNYLLCMGISRAILAAIIVMILLNYIPLLQSCNHTFPLYAKGRTLPDYTFTPQIKEASWATSSS